MCCKLYEKTYKMVIFKKIFIILIILTQILQITSCTVYIGWEELEFENIGTIKVPRGLKLSQVDGNYYISDKPISDNLSKVYFTQTVSLDEPSETRKDEANYFTDSFKVLQIGESNPFWDSTYGTLYCLIDGEIMMLEYFNLYGKNEHIRMVAWPDQVEKGVVKKIAKSFEPYY